MSGGEAAMFGDGSLTFREWATQEPRPLAVVHDAVLEFLRRPERRRAVRRAARSNAYVSESRMTQDVDIASPRAAELAEELRIFLRKRFRMAVQVTEVKSGADTVSSSAQAAESASGRCPADGGFPTTGEAGQERAGRARPS